MCIRDSYISIYLWLPVSDLFSRVLARIQTLMLQKDIQELSDPNFIPDGSSTCLLYTSQDEINTLYESHFQKPV